MRGESTMPIMASASHHSSNEKESTIPIMASASHHSSNERGIDNTQHSISISPQF